MSAREIYLVIAPQANSQLFAISAFDCRECADLLAAWYRRDKVPAEVKAIPLTAHLRAYAQTCVGSLPAGRDHVPHDSQHVPAQLHGSKKSA